jgi:signal transduction histidine kinase
MGIQRSLAGMRRLAGDLLDIAAIEAGRLNVEPASGDVATLLRMPPSRSASPRRLKAGKLELEEAPEAIAAVFDHDRVIQVLGNLVGNSIKFTPKGGKISLRLVAVGEQVQFTVSDTGAGIPADKLEWIFDRFTRVLPSDRRGLGLGLYISRCLVEAQRGRIWASSGPGPGSSVSFTLPLAR